MDIKSNSKKGLKLRDPRLILEASKNAPIHLPNHQKALRDYLLAQHTYRHSLLRRTRVMMKSNALILRSFITARNWSPIVLPVMASGVLAGFLTLQPGPPMSRAQWLAVAARTELRHMSRSQVDHISAAYHQDLGPCLNEAIQNKTLRLIPIDQVRMWVKMDVVQQYHAIANNYLTYTDHNRHRIVIALSGNYEPLYVLDIDALIAKPDPTLNSKRSSQAPDTAM